MLFERLVRPKPCVSNPPTTELQEQIKLEETLIAAQPVGGHEATDAKMRETAQSVIPPQLHN
jgi:hypothetical protein